MSDTIDTTAEVITSLPQPSDRKPSFVQAVFGQLKDPTFWVDLFRVMATEAFKAFVYAFGGELMRYGSTGRTAGFTASLPNTSPVAQKAFGGYAPQPSYSPSTGFPVPTSAPTGDNRFPGFGSR